MIKMHKALYKNGLVIGKFYPPHRGHKYLIDTAKASCEHLTVILCWKKSETIPAIFRAQWLQKIHPDVEIKVIEDNKLDDNDSKGWAKFTLDILGYRPDAVFTSESYGDPYAAFMGTIHVLVDRDRTNVPISATMVRSDPMKYFNMLEPCVRGYFARRICIIGAESTGTTTLAKDLAKYYNTVWVPECGRTYNDGKLFGKDRSLWTSEEFEYVAVMQNTLENAMAEISNGLLICDTNAFATGIWHERYLGHRSNKVEEMAKMCASDLYILTGDEIPFIQDGTRDGETIRHQMHNRFIERLKEDNKPFVIVRGTPEQRLKSAVETINQLQNTI
jgi:NadR type nicotinamide-nucleotide adenylyltransferase